MAENGVIQCQTRCLFRALTEKMLVQNDPGLYFFINQGCLTVDNMDDQEEMRIVDVCRCFHGCFVPL